MPSTLPANGPGENTPPAATGLWTGPTPDTTPLATTAPNWNPPEPREWHGTTPYTNMLEMLSRNDNSHTLPAFPTGGGAYSRVAQLGSAGESQISEAFASVTNSMPELRSFTILETYQEDAEQRRLSEEHRPETIWNQIDRELVPNTLFGSTTVAAPHVQQLTTEYREYARAMGRFQRQNTEQLQIARAQNQQLRATRLARRYANTTEVMWAPNGSGDQDIELMCGIH